jgi:hypothetical protein
MPEMHPNNLRHQHQQPSPKAGKLFQSENASSFSSEIVTDVASVDDPGSNWRSITRFQSPKEVLMP